MRNIDETLRLNHHRVVFSCIIKNSIQIVVSSQKVVLARVLHNNSGGSYRGSELLYGERNYIIPDFG